ncbi:M1 family metallopeptidase [Candidatus Nitrosocosmicus hydrocola]|uniref:M1 family metallopeptidase n=1 Tax=Candidatus Nitrosocosmicus hydrocola TaxID=1826872 RepID=UPI0011E5A9F6|nr:M1 family metallopeptidase [Candidatus Nitrosocosmicus hydrocola]
MNLTKNNKIENANCNDSNSTTRHGFEFPGSRLHSIPRFPYAIEHMSLRIFPDFQKIILGECTQILRLKFLRNTSKIQLDIAELKIVNVTSSSSNIKILNFELENDKKLSIYLANTVEKGSSAEVCITYLPGYYNSYDKAVMEIGAPKTGFHFMVKKNTNDNPEAYQAWTQGETTEAKYWFPCIDSPNAKFYFDIEISVPIEYDVISNGKLISKIMDEKNQKAIWKFSETNPIPAYLVSVVIGKFSRIDTHYLNVPLEYYWPEEIHKENAMLTFSETPQMIKFFEDYFETKYPFEKYTQVAVDNFEFGGMENLSCTTFTRRVLHDKKTTLDYKNDLLLIVHELAHQWFGDLVTCKEWSHIWLNEGFATYCESLYLENSRGIEEFHYSLIESTDVYFEEANENYVRPIVTNLYKHPDELFDAHSYEKAGFILHMLRNFLGEVNFKESLKKYLNRYQNSSVVSNDLQETIEEVSGIQVQTFFDQWIYRKGHPELEIEYTLQQSYDQTKSDKQLNKLKIKAIQSHQTQLKDHVFMPPYRFELEFKIVIQDVFGRSKQISHLMNITQLSSESLVEIDGSSSISYVSIDPHFKIIKTIKSIKVIDESKEFQLKNLLLNQLVNGDTVIERIQSTRSLKDIYDHDVVESLREIILDKDMFYGVSKEAVNTIGSYKDKNNYSKSDNAYQTLLAIAVEKENFTYLNNHVKRAILKNVGLFERADSIDVLISIFNDPTIDSDFIKSAAAAAMGKSCKTASSQEKIRIMLFLKEIVNSSDSFQSVVATGAIDGLGELSSERNVDNKEIYLEVGNFILQNTSASKDYFIRAKSSKLLGKFLINKMESTDSDIVNLNQRIFDRLRDLLKDERRKIKMNACEALSDEDAKFTKFPDKITYESIQILVELAREDLDGFVRRKAETSANHIRKWIHSWSGTPLLIDSD